MTRILIAEDETEVRFFVSRALTHKGFEVKAVEDGALALEALQDESFDLLLTDIVMPVMDGIALALTASERYPQLPILMMSGYAEARRRAHNLDHLIHEVIEKPFTINALADAVLRTLENPANPAH